MIPLRHIFLFGSIIGLKTPYMGVLFVHYFRLFQRVQYNFCTCNVLL
jgi:hypothetical protein